MRAKLNFELYFFREGAQKDKQGFYENKDLTDWTAATLETDIPDGYPPKGFIFNNYSLDAVECGYEFIVYETKLCRDEKGSYMHVDFETIYISSNELLFFKEMGYVMCFPGWTFTKLKDSSTE